MNLNTTFEVFRKAHFKSHTGEILYEVMLQRHKPESEDSVDVYSVDGLISLAVPKDVFDKIEIGDCFKFVRL